MPKIVPQSRRDRRTKYGFYRMERQLMFPPGNDHLSDITNEYLDGVDIAVAERCEREGRRQTPYEAACKRRVKVALGIHLLAVHAMRTDQRLQYPDPDNPKRMVLDLTKDQTHRVLDRAEKSGDRFAAALKDLGLDKRSDDQDPFAALHRPLTVPSINTFGDGNATQDVQDVPQSQESGDDVQHGEASEDAADSGVDVSDNATTGANHQSQ